MIYKTLLQNTQCSASLMQLDFATLYANFSAFYVFLDLILKTKAWRGVNAFTMLGV